MQTTQTEALRPQGPIQGMQRLLATPAATSGVMSTTNVCIYDKEKLVFSDSLFFAYHQVYPFLLLGRLTSSETRDEVYTFFCDSKETEDMEPDGRVRYFSQLPIDVGRFTAFCLDPVVTPGPGNVFLVKLRLLGSCLERYMQTCLVPAFLHRSRLVIVYPNDARELSRLARPVLDEDPFETLSSPQTKKVFRLPYRHVAVDQTLNEHTGVMCTATISMTSEHPTARNPLLLYFTEDCLFPHDLLCRVVSPPTRDRFYHFIMYWMQISTPMADLSQQAIGWDLMIQWCLNPPCIPMKDLVNIRAIGIALEGFRCQGVFHVSGQTIAVQRPDPNTNSAEFERYHSPVDVGAGLWTPFQSRYSTPEYGHYRCPIGQPPVFASSSPAKNMHPRL
jgi:hypothetical protein